MASNKFDETDRQRCVAAVESHFGSSLRPKGRRRKWFLDGTGRHFWIIGGYGEWHGIPEDMVSAALQRPAQTIIVIAVRESSAMRLYAGTVAELVRNLDKLYRARQTTGDYQFTYRIRGDLLVVDQVSAVALPRIASIPYDREQKTSDAHVREAKKVIASLSESEKLSLLKALASKGT